jgi:hypothetical protein
MSDDLTKLSSENIKYLTDIKNYIDVHEKDFKQVFFQVDPDQIKSSYVGTILKDIYGNDQIKPVYTVPGLHTQNTCKMNTVVYANEKIDYNSSNNYTPGINEIKVDGDFANSPNYFLTSPPANVSSDKVSVEISGYISTKTLGNYKLAIVNFPQHLLAWVGNNAQKSYRKENTMCIIENGVKIKDHFVLLVAGEYTPFRVQYSYIKGSDPIDYTKLFATNNNNIFIDTFAKGPDTAMYYYSLKSSDTENLYTCNIYNGSDLKKISDEIQQVKIAWSKNINNNTEFVCLDMTGDLWAYNSLNEKIEIVFAFSSIVQDCTLTLYDEPNNRDIVVIQNKKQVFSRFFNNISKVCINTTQIGVKMSELVTNQKWKNESSSMLIETMNNIEKKVYNNRKISSQRISEANPLYSKNFKFKLCIMKDNNGNKTLSLIASIVDPEKFYTAEPDLKMNKLFYASTYPENKFLREVPAELQTNSSYYDFYANMHPLDTTNFTETAYSMNNNCRTQCNATPGCNYLYNLYDTSAKKQKCLLSNNNSSVPIFLPNSQNSKYSSSTLYIKRKIIKTGDANKDAVYDKTLYIPNGYKYTMNLGFSDYQIESKPLSGTDTPGPAGTSYVVELQNLVSQRTSNAPPISLTNTNSPMIAGAEPFTVANRSLAKLDEIETQFSQYASNVYKINPNRIDISNNLMSIDKIYLDMSGNQQKYDFTGSTIYSLEKEDRSISSALLKDNAIYKEEQNTLYMVTTLTMATLLVSAILISK